MKDTLAHVSSPTLCSLGGPLLHIMYISSKPGYPRVGWREQHGRGHTGSISSVPRRSLPKRSVRSCRAASSGKKRVMRSCTGTSSFRVEMGSKTSANFGSPCIHPYHQQLLVPKYHIAQLRPEHIPDSLQCPAEGPGLLEDFWQAPNRLL